MRSFLTIVLVSVAASLSAQVQSRPSDPPIVTAENDAWFSRGDPVQYAGNTYYQAGADVFFDGNRMVRAGIFNGVPLYVDTTLEPYSVVFVPIGRGLMQPYERPRSGDLAGTTGSRAPSFPVSAQVNGWTPPMAPSPPTGLGPIPVLGEEVTASSATDPIAFLSTLQAPSTEQRGTVLISRSAAPPLTPADIQRARERVWVEYRGERWIPAGPAIPIENSGLVKTGEYAGFPVFSYTGQEDRIFLPALPGLAAPYQLKR
jgi:hypothetical protein